MVVMERSLDGVGLWVGDGDERFRVSFELRDGGDGGLNATEGYFGLCIDKLEGKFMRLICQWRKEDCSKDLPRVGWLQPLRITVINIVTRQNTLAAAYESPL
ncbi:hypothetical protein LguiB_032929 [Lonicera macranthoides]